MNYRSTAVLCWGAAVFLFLIVPFAQAKDPLLIGKEVEVTADYLVHLIPYFDVSGFAQPGATPREIAVDMITQGGDLQIRADCPKEIRSLLEKMNWSYDSGALEFRDTLPFASLDEYVAHTNAFLKLVKMDGLENEPMKHLGKTRFHFHLSVMNGRNHREIAERLNGLAVLKFIEGGTGDMALVDNFGFMPVDGKGLLRLHSEERIEIRNHFISPEGDARELYRLLTQPEADSRRELSTEIRKRLTPEAIRLLALHRPDMLVQLVERTNRDLPTRLDTKSPAIFDALKAAASHADAHLPQMTALLRNAEAKALAPELAQLLQERALESPQKFFRAAGEFYTDLLTAIHDQTPADKRKFTMNDPRWVDVLVPPVTYKMREALAKLMLVSKTAREAAVKALPTTSGLFAEITPEHLKFPEVRAACLAAVARADGMHYQTFLRRANEKEKMLDTDFLPFLKRGLTWGDPRAKYLKAVILGQPIPPGCEGYRAM